MPVKLYIQSEENPDDFILHGVRPIPSGASPAAIARFAARMFPRLFGEPLILTSAVGHILSSDWIITSRNKNEALYVECACFARDNGETIAPSRAAHLYYRQQLMAVECLVLSMTGGRDDAATCSLTKDIDRRLSLRSVKDILCNAAGLNPAKAQLLIDNNSREIRNMDLSLSAAAIGVSKGTAYRVQLLPYPPIPQEDAFVDVFRVVKPINYAAPVAFVKRLHASPDTLISDLVQEAFPGEDASLLRPRLLPPGQKLGLGVPMLLPTVLANVTPAHRQNGGDLRVAFEAIAEAESLEKGTLILHLHRWLSEIDDCKLAFGDGIELLFHKEMPASALVEAVSHAFHLDLGTFDAAPAKFYALHSHDTCYTKVPWGILHDAKVVLKPVAAHPLKLEMDDIILVRSLDEAWEFVSENAREEGHLPFVGGAGTTSRKQDHARCPQDGSGGNGGGVGAEKKKARSEKSIAIRAVWELSDEDTVATETHVSEISSASPLEAAAQRNEAGTLPYDTFDLAVHGTLDDSCQICVTQYEPGEIVSVLSCHHMFHRDCLAAWVNTRAVCPQCMNPIW